MALLQGTLGPTSGGLDRDSMNVYAPVEIQTGGEEGSQSSAETDEDANNESGPKSSLTANISRVSKKVRSKLRTKVKDTGLSSKDEENTHSRYSVPTLAPAPPETCEKDRFNKAPPRKPKLPPAQDFLLRPVKTGRTIMNAHGGNDLAENLAKTDTTHEASVRLLRAHDKVDNAQTSEDEKAAKKEVAILQGARQDSFVRWTIDRHIHNVTRMEAHRLPQKSKKHFIGIDESGRQSTQWGKYGNHLFISYLEKHGGPYIDAASSPSDSTAEFLKAAFERFLLASTPLQHLVMRIRDISQWKDPSESVACMMIYCTLLYYNIIVSSILLLVVVAVVARLYSPSTLEEMRSYLEFSEDRESRAADLSQHIERYGGHRWVDSLVEKAGPDTLLHLEDIADMMEIVRNFYEWRDPARTAFSLGVITVLWLAVTFLPSWILVKGVFLYIGIFFFVLIPIAHHYPRYRLLLSPFTWTFWKIPTYAQWAIARLQAEARHNLATSHSDRQYSPKGEQESHRPSESNPPHATDAEQKQLQEQAISVGRYHCTNEKRPGSLCISTDSASFETAVSSNQRWVIPYRDMESIQKIDSTVAMKPGDDILFRHNDGREFQVASLMERDVVFSQILGYSNVQWQRTG